MNHVHKFVHQMGDEAVQMCECGEVLTKVIAKRKMKEVIKALNAMGFTGGMYHYKRGECSCCYGNGSDNFFQVNGNIPGNWIREKGHFSFKVSYNIDNKEEADAFRVAANRLCLAQFGNATEQADDIHKAILIQVSR